MFHIIYSLYLVLYFFIDLFFVSHLLNIAYKKTSQYLLMGIIVVYAVVCPFLYDLSINRGIISLLNYALLSLPVFFLHLKIKDTVKWSIASILYMMIIEMISSIPALIILSLCNVQVSNVIELYLNHNILLIPILLSSTVVMLLLTYVVLKFLTLDRIKSVFTYLFIPGVLLLLLIEINGVVSNLGSQVLLQVVTYVIAFVVSLVLLYLYNRQLKNYAKLKTENNQAKLMQEMQNKQIEDINVYYKKIRKEDHDTNNHLRTINLLLENQSYTETIDYINHMLKEGSAL